MANILGVASVGFLDASLNVKDAALSQDIVRLAKLPVNDVPLFSVKPKEDLPNWKTDPEKFLDAANKAFFGSLNPKYQGALKFLSSCLRFDQRALNSKTLNIFKQVPATAPATTLTAQERD